MAVFRAVRQRINQPTDVDVIVQELELMVSARFRALVPTSTLTLPLLLLSRLSMVEFFKTMDAVAAEELAAVNFSKWALINRDDIPGVYAADITNPNLNTYGTTDSAEYRFTSTDYTFEGWV